MSTEGAEPYWVKRGAMNLSDPKSEQPEDAPPLLGSWRRIYSVVIAWLVFLIAIFYLFARRFAA